MRVLQNNRCGTRTSKEELRKEYGLNEDDVLFLDDAMTFATEYLFPRFKFHHKGIVYVGKAASTDSEGKDICRRVG